MHKFIKNILSGGFASIVVLAAPAVAAAATLSLSPTSGTFTGGTTFEVKIQLDTAGATTSGTDAYVRFDPNVLQVVDANTSTEGTQILPGSLYSQTSYNLVDNGAGKISFSGSKSGGSPGYSGTGTLATVTFSAIKDSSDTDVTFDFTKSSTTDSNVIDQSSSDDVLTAVTNASYVIKAGTATSDPDSVTCDETSGASCNNNGGGTDTDTDGDGIPDATDTDGRGGSGTVAGTGINLSGYLILTLISLIGTGYFLTRRPKTR